MDHEVKKIYLLTCEDATMFGKPAMTEYTTHLWTRPFYLVDSAKKFAESVAGKELGWGGSIKRKLSCNAGVYIFTIEESEIK